MVIRLPGDYERAMAEAVAASRRKAEEYAKAREEPRPDITKCELCHRAGPELRSYGSPTSYLACTDVQDCELHRKEDVDFGSQKGWPE